GDRAEPRGPGGRRVGAGRIGVQGEPGQSQRRLGRGAPPRDQTDRDGSVPPGGLTRTARCAGRVRQVRGTGSGAPPMSAAHPRSATFASYLAKFTWGERSRRLRLRSAASPHGNQPETANRAQLRWLLGRPIAANAQVACVWPDAVAAGPSEAREPAPAHEPAPAAEPAAAA